jgi:hypothetical protein
MKSPINKSITALVLVSFLVLVLFSFGAVMHESGNQMTGDCPFSTVGGVLCPQNALAVAMHHISAYNSFFNIPVSFGLTALLLSFLLALSIVHAVRIRPPRLEPYIVVRIAYDVPPASSYSKKINHWLSLFENSPSHR